MKSFWKIALGLCFITVQSIATENEPSAPVENSELAVDDSQAATPIETSELAADDAQDTATTELVADDAQDIETSEIVTNDTQDAETTELAADDAQDAETTELAADDSQAALPTSISEIKPVEIGDIKPAEIGELVINEPESTENVAEEAKTEIVNLNDADNDMITNIMLGKLPNVVLEVSEGSRLPLNIFLKGDFIELVSASATDVIIQVNQNLYMKNDNGQVQFSTKSSDWKSLCQFVTGMTSVSLTREQSGSPCITLSAEIFEKKAS